MKDIIKESIEGGVVRRRPGPIADCLDYFKQFFVPIIHLPQANLGETSFDAYMKYHIALKCQYNSFKTVDTCCSDILAILNQKNDFGLMSDLSGRDGNFISYRIAIVLYNLFEELEIPATYKFDQITPGTQVWEIKYLILRISEVYKQWYTSPILMQTMEVNEQYILDQYRKFGEEAPVLTSDYTDFYRSKPRMNFQYR